MPGRVNVVNLGRSDVPWADANASGGPLGSAFLTAATSNGAGGWKDVSGLKSIWIEVIETAGGTATLTLQGTLNETNVYSLWTAPLAATFTYTATISITANLAAYFTVRDITPLMRASLASIAGGASVSVNYYALPV